MDTRLDMMLEWCLGNSMTLADLAEEAHVDEVDLVDALLDGIDDAMAQALEGVTGIPKEDLVAS